MKKNINIALILLLLSFCTDCNSQEEYIKVIALDENESGTISQIRDIEYSKNLNKIFLVDGTSCALKVFDTAGSFLFERRVEGHFSDSVVKYHDEDYLNAKVMKNGKYYTRVLLPIEKMTDSKSGKNDGSGFKKAKIQNIELHGNYLYAGCSIPLYIHFKNTVPTSKVIRAIGAKDALVKFDINNCENQEITVFPFKSTSSTHDEYVKPYFLNFILEKASNSIILLFNKIRYPHLATDRNSVIAKYSLDGSFSEKIGLLPEYLKKLNFNYFNANVRFCQYNNDNLIYSYETSDSVFFADGRNGFKLKNLPSYSSDIYERLKIDSNYAHLSHSEKLKTFASAIRQIVRLNNGNILLWICKIRHSNGQRDFQEHFQEYSTDGELVRELNINDLNERYGELKKICYVPEDNTIIEVRCGEEDWLLCHRKWK